MPTKIAVANRERSLRYRNEDCSNCGRLRVETNGICEKCGWDADGDEYIGNTRPVARCIICRGEMDASDPLAPCPDEHWHSLTG